MDYHIPNQSSYNTTETEFEMFYQIILQNLLHIPENQLAELRSKFCNACHKYNNIKVPNKYQKIVKDLANNKTIQILRQDKGRGIVIMDSSKFIEKCLSILDNEKIVKITNDPMKHIECKIQQCVRKIKTKLAKKNTYSCILLVLHLKNFKELPKFTSYLMQVILLNFLLDQWY